MCYNPITIVNPCKYVSVKYRDRFLLQVPCGKCAECQRAKSREWNFRTYYEFIRTFEEDEANFVYFDTLTYSDEHLPFMDEIVSELPHLPCFRTTDITKFLKRLRINLKRKFCIDRDAFSYFICSEYGSLRGRPHYHLLLFIRAKIDPMDLSLLVSKTWNLGRTDGLSYQSKFYVMQHNVIKNSRLGDIIACAKYVTKYVEKDCKLQSTLDARLRKADLVLKDLEKNGSVDYKKMITKIASEVNQFHLQSLHFGENALRDIDLIELLRTGCVRMPSHQIVSLVPIPNYYLRKMFYDKYILDGNFGWQLNQDGLEFKKKRLPYLKQQMKDRFTSLNLLAGTSFDVNELADYVIHKRGRFISNVDETTIEQRINDITHYVYVTQSDKKNVGVGISEEFLGNSKLGYQPFSSNIIKLKDFISKYVYLDNQLEDQLKVLYQSTSVINSDSQLYYSRIQELESLFKNLTY